MDAFHLMRAIIGPDLIIKVEGGYTFNTMNEALAKLRTGQLSSDVFFPTVDVLGPLIQTKLIQPLNHSYIPNISQA